MDEYEVRAKDDFPENPWARDAVHPEWNAESRHTAAVLALAFEQRTANLLAAAQHHEMSVDARRMLMEDAMSRLGYEVDSSTSYPSVVWRSS